MPTSPISTVASHSTRFLGFAIAIALLGAGGCSAMEKTGSTVTNFWDNLSGHSAFNASLQMENTELPDQRRIGINALSDRSFGRGEPYTKRYEMIATSDPDFLVRATAIRALNRSRWADATPVFIGALADKNQVVRLEGAKALANVPDPKAIPPLMKLVTSPDESRDVKVAAADALKHYKSMDVARTLVDQLGQRDFSVAWQARQSLKKLTGKDLHYDGTAWLTYLTSPDRPVG